jgi:predicted acyltransferase
VLHRIAACYLVAALIYVWCAQRLKTIAGIAAALLVGYWALLTFVPFPDLRLEKTSVEEIAKRIGSHDPAAISAAVPGRVRGTYEEHRNLANYLDFRFLPGKKMATYYINEGLLSTLPSIAICLFGIFAGRLLKGGTDPRRKVVLLFAAGAAGVLLGWLWSFQFPLIKRIWTSSFILVSSGYSAMMLGLFYYIVDVRKWNRWCEPLVWIGMNPITLYLSARFINYTEAAEKFVGGDVKAFFDSLAQGLGSLFVATFALGLVFLLAWFLHRRRIFLRV